MFAVAEDEAGRSVFDQIAHKIRENSPIWRVVVEGANLANNLGDGVECDTSERVRGDGGAAVVDVNKVKNGAMMSANDEHEHKVLNEKPVILDNITCPYCSVALDESNKTKEHVVGRRFVPKGKFDGRWNLILNACATCNGQKADLEDDASAVTMQPDVQGVHAVDDQVLTKEAVRKGRAISRRTKKPVSQSHARISVTVPLPGGATMKAEFVGPPQLDVARALQLAAFHVDAFVYWLTYDETKRIGRRLPGDLHGLVAASRPDWGNAALKAFMNKTIEWEPLLIAPAADGFFKIAIRRHRNPLCWAWALEWNHSFRLVGFIGEHESMAHHAKGIELEPRKSIVEQSDRIVRYRKETALKQDDDVLFSWNDAPKEATDWVAEDAPGDSNKPVISQWRGLDKGALGQRFAVSGPIADARKEQVRGAFNGEGVEVAGQYQYCLFGDRESPSPKVFHLLDTEAEAIVGFVGIKVGLQDCAPEIQAFISVEFVFLRAAYRKSGLSKFLLSAAADFVEEWIAGAKRELKPGEHLLAFHTSSPKSDEGKRFLESLDRDLEGRLHRLGVELFDADV